MGCASCCLFASLDESDDIVATLILDLLKKNQKRHIEIIARGCCVDAYSLLENSFERHIERKGPRKHFQC